MNMKWYIVYTKPDSEKKVSDLLTRRKIENYNPLHSTVQICSDHKKVKDTPLFKGYVFVKTTEHQHQNFRKINGIVNFVHWMGKPVSVKNVEIKAIKLFLSEYSNITLEKTAIRSNVTDAVDYSAPEQEAPMITIRNKKAHVGLPSLGYIMTAEVDTPNVRIISAEGTLTKDNMKSSKLFSRVSEFNNSLKSYWVKAFAISICILLFIK